MKLTSRKDELLTDRSRDLRKNMTEEEKHLWYDYLSKQSIRFYRQRVINGYIADFYCPKLKLVIELDGRQHYSDRALDYDAHRTEDLEKLGIEVLRFTNLQIKKAFRSVCFVIRDGIEEKSRELGVNVGEGLSGN